ncbi:gliding motility-associated C-terminal domain-containing protein [Gramella sp. MAR_2010_147]|uniref:gliding motility-associated C-terminal domain-containing protein n=1 Tax=Gramella sp. MAR_2010_147 TaxID=1250205 RepID=UPI00087DF019|nr:gliding motility-associated C-terminal domain-containing protein [Gramella sp. MAR_2010_147]SDS55043.1 gliding motility-associated C-terminal domain-containing protein [Gramella sp. MAR_2010_147]
MQNFTFGRKGLNWFLFAFILFVGNLASYGQDCATPGSDQNYCYLETVDDLRYSDATNGAVYETADTENDTDPIDGDELLTNGETYFIGSTTEDCNRVPVTVTVVAADTPMNTVTNDRSDFTISPCESSGYTAGQLEDLFTADSGYQIEVYDEEFGTTPMADGEPLVAGDSYFVGQVDGDTSDSNDLCPSTRAAVGYDPLESPAPTADANQTYCEGATVADLMASGTEPNTQAIRWYRSRTSNSPLADDVELINGEDYFAAQVVNDRNSPFPPCETSMDERTQIIVEVITFDAGADASETICQGDLEERLDGGESPTEIFLSLVDDRSLPSDVTFNPTISSLVSDYNDNPFQTFTTLATFTTTEGCEDDVELAVTVVEDPDAGEDGTVTLSSTDDPINLFDSLNGTPDMGGTWSPGDGTFDPSTDSPGDFTYTVDNGSCSDSATVTVIVEGCTANAGDDNLNNTICRDQIVANPSQDQVRAYFRTLIRNASSTSGTFSDIPSITSRIRAGESGPFNTTYTVEAGTSCEDTAEFSASIVEPSEANAGDFDNIEAVCSNDESIDLTSLENNDPDATPGGMFTGEGVTDNVFDPSIGAGTYTITYSVDDSLPCVTGEDDIDFTISVQDAPDAGEDGTVTLSSTDDPINLFDSLNGTPDMGGTWSPGDGTFDPSTDSPGDFTYTVDNGSCSDSATVTVIVEGCTANAGDDNLNNTICRDQIVANPSQDQVRAYFRTLIRNASSTSGTFSDIPSITSRIRAGESGPFNTTYTVEAGTSCEDTAEFSASIVEPSEANAGDFDNIEAVCSNDESIDLTSLENNDPDATPGGMFTGEGVTDNVFDPSIGAGTYTITYSVDDSLPCVTGEDDIDFTISVQDAPDAGEDGTVTLSSTDDPINLFDSLNGTPDMGGTWSPGDGTFDPSTDSPGDFTYTVDNGSCSDSATVTVIVEGCTANAGDDNLNNTICRDQIVANPSQDQVRAYFRTLIRNASSTSGTFSDIPSITSRIRAGESGPFNTTYTVEAGTSCEDTAEFSASIVEPSEANAGDFDNIEAVCSNDESIDLTSLENNDPDATPGGMFTGEGVTDNVFDPSIGAGTYTITYSVDDSLPCVTGSDSTTFEITVEDSPISTSISRTLCITDARDLISNPTAGIAFLQGLVEETGVEDFDADNFSDGAIAEATRLSNFIDTPTSDSETFNFEYTDPSESICDDGVISIEITITNEQDADAGNIEDQTVCESNGMIDLTTFFTEETVPGGTFSGMGVDGDMFDTSLGSNEDGYEITYSVDDSADCVTEGTSDSTTFTIFIDEAVEAGAPNSANVCRVEVNDLFPNNSSVRNFYLDLLEDGTPRNGTFAPTVQQLISSYNSNPDQDEFTTTYTISNGSCSDSVELTINVVDSLPAEIGDIADPDPICRNAEDVDLFSFLPEDANPNGTFEGYEDGIFSPGLEGEGSFEITYTLTDDSPCTVGEASATFTITVLESAFAGMNMDLSVCMDEDAQDLFSFLSIDADTTGEFTLDGNVIADGMLNPADLAAGEYTVIYTVEAINDCGDDTAEFTVTVEEAPGAPTVDGNPFTFCATDGATGADLSATGSNLTFYSDEDLTMMLAAEDALATGTYYVTQRNDDGGCESEATEISVTINDAATPTISETNPTFCEFDDATLADLTDLINETGTVTWYDSADGDNALNNGTSLQNGVTYYATLFNVDTGCESSVRLAVTVTIDDDCPLTIPEGFSPNGDGLNDRFEIRNIRDKYPNFTMEIRNRFGDVVYKGNANTPDWDGFSTEGSFGSDVLPVGAYFYYLNYNDGSTEPVRGTVYLSR